MTTATEQIVTENTTFPEAPTENSDELTHALANAIRNGWDQVESFNKDYFASDEGRTKASEIDAKLKTPDSIEDSDVQKLAKQMVSAREKYKTALKNARNAYRTNVLGEDAKDDKDDEDLKERKEEIQAVRKSVMDSVSLLKTYATANGKSNFVEWAESLAIPQVGRNATSSVTGIRRPHAYVTVNSTVYNSFGEAAAAMTEANKQEAKETDTPDEYQKYNAGDLINKWVELSEPKGSEFEFSGGWNLVVRDKEKKDKAA